jgi:hypothetical protein
MRLDRRSSPGTYALTPLLRTTITLGAALKLPDDDFLIWAHLHLRKTLLGALMTTLFKAPIVKLEVTFRDGEVRAFRIVPAEVAAGFLLSPFVEDRIDFIALQKSQLREWRMHRHIVSVRLLPQRFAALAYQNEVAVKLESSTLPGGPTQAAAHSPRDASSTDR